MPIVSLQLGDLRIEGWSRAGDETWIRIHPPGLAFDVGRGALPLAGARDLFVSHGHLDHVLGIPFLLSQRSLYQLPSARVFCPRQIAAPLEELIASAARLEGRSYSYHLVPLEPGDRHDVGRHLAVEAFATDHVEPSLGFHLLRRKQRLAPPFRGKPQEELRSLSLSGVAIQEETEELWVSYCGDTGPRVFELDPRILRAPILLIECTFLQPDEAERARRYKHVHLLDLASRAEDLTNRALVLYHLSHRHRRQRLLEEVGRHLPHLKDRIHLLM